jgi:hypothetical protein
MAKNGNTSWIARCKAYMKQHGCQLGEAMKALSNKNKGRGKSFRGGNSGGVAANAEAFQSGSDGPAGGPSAGAPPPPPPPSSPQLNAVEKFGGLFEVGGTPPQPQAAGRRRRSHRKRGGKKSRCGSKRKSGSKRRRHRSRRGGSGGSSSLSFSDYA